MIFLHSLRHKVKRILLKLGFFRYPDFLIIGAQKAGTTYLYSLLRQHPQILEPVHKEAHFFEDDINFSKGPLQYQLNFDLSFRFRKNEQTFEATPDYLPSFKAQRRIKEFLPEVKLIVLLREPISRAFSAWKMQHFAFKDNPKYVHLHDPRDFDEVIKDSLKENRDEDKFDHLHRSKYGRQLESLFELFEEKKILILFYQDLIDRPQESVNLVTNFAGLDEFNIDNVNPDDPRYWTNESSFKNAKLTENQKLLLKDYFITDHQILESILKTKIKW